jgi:hypothetical protein
MIRVLQYTKSRSLDLGHRLDAQVLTTRTQPNGYIVPNLRRYVCRIPCLT